MKMKSDKPNVKLIGRDGNAFAIIGACLSSARKSGWDKSRIEAFKSEAMEGDYNHLLQVAMQNFEVT